MDVDLVLLLRLTYVGLATLIAVVYAVPPLRARFLSYGARQAAPSEQQRTGGRSKQGIFAALLDLAASVCVPHSWFTSFYAVSVSCSLYWAIELLFRGPSFAAVSDIQGKQSHSMGVDQIKVAWLMMFVQGSRRLYECLMLSRPSDAKMWVGHWVVGLLFYICTNIAIWIEGTSAVQVHQFSLHDMYLQAPSLRTFVGVLLFILASGFQHDCHAYLASLKTGDRKTYSLPEHPAWNLSLTPHYFAECLIYLALTIATAPAGSIVNMTLLCALIFVIVNLGVTANGTKEWYTQKFGNEQTRGRARMIPFLF